MTRDIFSHFWLPEPITKPKLFSPGLLIRQSEKKRNRKTINIIMFRFFSFHLGHLCRISALVSPIYSFVLSCMIYWEKWSKAINLLGKKEGKKK